ncbi:MAG: acetyl-CoA decarbonylase/synthase complex subunit delta [Synergistaceae bacterium]|jgi:acetyl-CoA decarbonylase/synthase complex subunit delta|nr:acetyl-CoA decarbonylase/synthase complex subunit delta [Synergistaceae bacterium]
MAFKRVPQVFNSSLKEVTIGTGDSAVTIGGENVLPLYGFDGPVKNAPKVGIELSDLGPNKSLPGIAAFYEGLDTIPAMAKRACEAPGASFFSLTLESSDPAGEDRSVDECAALCKEVANAVNLPLVVQGSGNAEKDARLFEKIAGALEGKNVLLMSAKEENYKGVAVAAVTAYNQKIGAESSVDINLAKQLNVLITQLGISGENVVMNLGISAAGYGFEYIASTIDRVRIAALSQNDAALQMPVITPVAHDAWSVKESLVSEEDFPDWGPLERRGISMEICTAAALIAAGSDAVILLHPESVAAISKMVAAFV